MAIRGTRTTKFDNKSSSKISSPSQLSKGFTSPHRNDDSEKGTTVTRRETPTRIQLSDLEKKLDSTSTPRSGKRRNRSSVRDSNSNKTIVVSEPRNIEMSIFRTKSNLSPNQDDEVLDRIESGTQESEHRQLTASARQILRISQLEERMAYKTGIPLESEEEEDDPVEVTRTSFERCVSKLANNPVVVKRGAGGGMTMEKSMAENDNGQSRSYNDQGGTWDMEEGHDDSVLQVGEIVETLAIAVAVDGEKVVIPSAIEYDPALNLPIYKNRRFRFYGSLCCVLVIVAIAFAMISTFHGVSPNTIPSEPTAAPLSPRHEEIQQRLEKQVGRDNLTDPDKVEYQALKWLVDDDVLELDPSSDHLYQRFLLVFFYLKTHEENMWLSCNAPSGTQPADTCSYYYPISFFPTEVYEAEERIRWLSTHHECFWAGVLCDENERVVSIDLTAQDITGTLPTEFTSLESLQILMLAGNNFYGSIPEEYMTMSQLASLEVHHNALTGTVPSGWSDMKSLLKLNIAGNEFTGTLPTEMGTLSLLRGFFAYDNFLSGTFPSELMQLPMLGKLSKLTFVILSSSLQRV